MEPRKDKLAISLSGVSCISNDGDMLLDRVDLRVKRGECLLLMGRSGSGKTTITKCINGLIPSFEPSLALEGEVRVCGLDPSSCEMYELAELVGSVFQNPKSQFFNLTSNDELAFGLESRGVPVEEIEKRISRTVAALKAEHLLYRDVNKMSGGEKQSLVFASVDIAGPDVLVLDEPTANLDVSSIEALHDEIAAVKAQGKTVVIAEHRLYFASDLIDRAVLIEGGRVSREFSPGELMGLGEEEREALGLRATDPDEALSVTVPRALPGEEGEVGGGPEGLELSAYTVLREGAPVFDPVSVSVPTGKVLGVLGENGAGKSTLLRGLAGLERHEAGEVRLGGARQARKGEKALGRARDARRQPPALLGQRVERMPPGGLRARRRADPCAYRGDALQARPFGQGPDASHGPVRRAEATPFPRVRPAFQPEGAASRRADERARLRAYGRSRASREKAGRGRSGSRPGHARPGVPQPLLRRRH